MNLYRLVLNESRNPMQSKYEYLGEKMDIWHLWYTLTKTLDKPNIEIFDLCGVKQEPEIGIKGLN